MSDMCDVDVDVDVGWCGVNDDVDVTGVGIVASCGGVMVA